MFKKINNNITIPQNRKLAINFILSLFILYTIWFFLYNLLLKPTLFIDRPLTNFISVAVVKCINLFSPTIAPIAYIENSNEHGFSLIKDNASILQIGHKCNGIDLMFTYVSIILLLPYPNSVKRKIMFCFVGIIALVIANIMRICALYYISVYQHNAFDFSHHYLFTILMYVLIFYGWLLFIKKRKAL